MFTLRSGVEPPLPREAFTNHGLRGRAARGDSPPGCSVSCAARRPYMGRRTRHVNRLIYHRGFVGSRILGFHQICGNFAGAAAAARPPPHVRVTVKARGAPSTSIF